MSQDRSGYLSYLIRMWKSKTKRGWLWRGSLEDPGSGERRTFANLDHLIAFLRAQADRQGPDGNEKELKE
jgi:hypothetical protein